MQIPTLQQQVKYLNDVLLNTFCGRSLNGIRLWWIIMGLALPFFFFFFRTVVCFYRQWLWKIGSDLIWVFWCGEFGLSWGLWVHDLGSKVVGKKWLVLLWRVLIWTLRVMKLEKERPYGETRTWGYGEARMLGFLSLWIFFFFFFAKGHLSILK